MSVLLCSDCGKKRDLNGCLHTAADCRDALAACLRAVEAERDRLVALHAAEAEKVIRRDERIAQVEAERDELGNEAVDRLILVSALRGELMATCERAQEVEVELAKANALLREALAVLFGSPSDNIRTRIAAHLGDG